MKNTEYYKSGKQLENVLIAQEKARVQHAINKSLRIEEYLKDPTHCHECGSILEYKKRKNKFCSSSCAATSNNRNRPPMSDEQKAKISNALEGRKYPGKGNNKNFSDVTLNICACCGKEFYTSSWKTKKSCGSRECKIHLSVGIRNYPNGRRKLFYYYNMHQEKEVLLESTWEYLLATWLDENDIIWERPKYVKWLDPRDNKERLYYPDFYLPMYKLYLDPKNPYVMDKDLIKMQEVSKLINIFYGNIDVIKKQVLDLL